jgi:hypothetical protein
VDQRRALGDGGAPIPVAAFVTQNPGHDTNIRL